MPGGDAGACPAKPGVRSNAPAQVALIDQVRGLIADQDIAEPDVIQPRPTNPGAIEVLWIDAKLCMVIESEQQIASMSAVAPPEAA